MADSPETAHATDAKHALWRVPGEYAKGILYESGRVHTWPEAEASHGAIARDHVQRTGDHPLVCFRIRPDGSVACAERHAHHAATLRAALHEADPSLTVVAARTPATSGHRVQDAAMTALCRWLEFGTPLAGERSHG